MPADKLPNPIVLAPTTLSELPALEYIDAAQRAGYDGIGIRLYPSPHLSFFPVVGNKTLETEVRKALADSDLQVYDILTCYVAPDMDLDAMKRAHEYGASLGAKYALVIGDDPDWNRMVDNFGRLCDTRGTTPGEPYCIPGDGIVPLRELLDVLPEGLPLSLECHLRDDRYTPLAWATHVLDGTQRFLRQYYASKRS